jgi:hypothetical protein
MWRVVKLLTAASLAACAGAGSGTSSSHHDTLNEQVPGTSAPETVCARALAKATREPVYMLFVLDGSASMIELAKWDSVTSAMRDFVERMRFLADPAFGVGLTIFSDRSDPTHGEGPYPKLDVPIHFVDDAHADALDERMAWTYPMWETPLASVLAGQYPNLASFQSEAPLLPGGRTVLVVMTDGVPYPATEAQKPVCLAEDSAAFKSPTAPTMTLAVGIGSVLDGLDNYDPRFLGALAIAGGFANVPCDPNELYDESRMCHFQITPNGKSPADLTNDFVRTIDLIRSTLASCELKLERAPGVDNLDPDSGDVVYTDGKGHAAIVVRDPNNGWTYDDPGNPAKVELHGAACKQARSDPAGSVSVEVGCRTVVH